MAARLGRRWRAGTFTGLTTAFGVTTDAAGNVYFTGNTTDSGHLKNVVLVKFSGAGDLIWSKVGGPGFGTGQNLPIALEAQNGQILPFESTSLGGRATARSRV